MKPLCFVLAAALAWLTGCGGGGALVASGASASTRPDLTVRRGVFQERFVMTGELEAVRSNDLSVPQMPMWQTTIRWLESDGATVAKGQKVVEFDNVSFVSDLEEKRLRTVQAESDLDQKEAEIAAGLADKEFQVEQRRVDLEKARTDASVPRTLLAERQYQERQLALARAEIENQKALEDLQAYRKSSQEDVVQLRISLDKARREIAVAERTIEQLTLIAPRDGILVVAEHPWEGRKLQVGDSAWVGLTVVRIPELDAMKVEVNLSDVDDGKVAPGMRVTCILDTYPDLVFPGRLGEITPVAQEDERRSLRRSFRAEVALEKSDPARMRPGMSVKVEVEAARRDGVLLAPREALDLSADPPRAFLSGGGDKPVKLGMCNAEDCIIEDGLEEGARLRSRG